LELTSTLELTSILEPSGGRRLREEVTRRLADGRRLREECDCDSQQQHHTYRSDERASA
jgi:hypothetical protein